MSESAAAAVTPAPSSSDDRSDRTIRALAWVLYLALAWIGGGITTWIAPWQQHIVMVAAALFGVVVVVALFGDRRRAATSTVPREAHEGAGSGSATDALLVSLVHLLPVFLLATLGVTMLGGQAMSRADLVGAAKGNTPVVASDPAAPAPGQPVPVVPAKHAFATLTPAAMADLDSEDDLPLSKVASIGGPSSPAPAGTQIVQTLGMVFPPEASQLATLPLAPTPDDVPLLLYRFEITCCAADAMPRVIGLRGIPRDRFPTDTWMRIRGKLIPGTAGGLAILEAESMQQVPEPKEPFLQRQMR